LELEALAGEPESTDVRATLNQLLNLRATTFSKDTPYTGGASERSFSIARNFMFLVPELGQYMRENLLTDVQEAVAEYVSVAPYWFVSDHDTAHSESASQHFYDYHALFQARALILQEPADALVKYLDVPAVQTGDLFYIHNLVAILGDEVSEQFDKSVTPYTGWQSDALVYTLGFVGSGASMTFTDTLPVGVSAPYEFALIGTSVTPVYNAGPHQITWSSIVPQGQAVVIHYTVDVITDEPQTLINTATLTRQQGASSTASVVAFANPLQVFLPLLLRFE